MKPASDTRRRHLPARHIRLLTGCAGVDGEQVLNQLEALQGDPRKVAMMMSQSEVKLREVAQAMVAGVEEYREDFEPGADELIDKFQVRSE